MKEGATLFCPKCGNPVSKDYNFCTHCGHNLKDVKVSFSSNSVSKKENTNKVEKISEHTRVFNPRSLDSIDTTDELKNIIAEVDRKISKNIEDYEKGNVQKKQPEKEKKTKSPLKDIEINNKSKDSNKKQEALDTKKADKEFLDANKEVKSDSGISQKELVRRVQEELKKSNFKENSKNTSSNSYEDMNLDSPNTSSSFEDRSSKKFSLKDKWKNFINEDDDEFSIFSTIRDDTKKKEDTRNLEISKSLEDSEKPFENTLSTPKIDIENAIKKSEENKSKEETKKKAEERKKEVEKNKTSEKKSLNSDDEAPKIDMTSKDKSPDTKKVSEEKKDSKASLDKDTKYKETKENKTQTTKESQKIKDNKKSKNLKDLFSFKEKGEKPVKEITSVDSKVEKEFSNKINNVEEKISKTSMDGLDKILQYLSKITTKVSDYIGEFGSKESKIVIAIGTVLSALALLIGSGSFKFILIVFLALKLLFDYFEFYVPLNIATDRDDIDTSYPEVKKFALINWIICKVFLFVGFLISPFGGFFKYNMLQALTAMPLATLILIILSLLIAITLYGREFIGRSKINFIGWYAIAFTLFELLFKMIWFIINFIFVTLF